jgi:glycosyltransferase involved in cell wall biosynthesis
MRAPGKVRVCILVPKLDLGGAEVQVLSQIGALDRSLLQVSLCCLTPGDPAMEEEARSLGIPLFHLGLRGRRLPLDTIRLARYFRREGFDVIHCHMPPADLVGRVAGWLAGVPVRITTEHGRGLWKSTGYVVLERLLNHITDQRICVSRDILEIRARREGTPRDKLAYLPNGVDLSRFASSRARKADIMKTFGWGPDDPLVVSLGRLVAEKDYPLLVEAIASVRAGIPGIRCVIAGEGERRHEMEARIRELDLAESIRLPGVRSDIAELLHAADVFVLSSIREGFPVSLIEAMAAGKAIAATRVGGIPDAIEDRRNGILVRAGDAAGLARAIERLIRDEGLRRKLGGVARDDARKRFSLEHIARQTEAIYLGLLSRKAGVETPKEAPGVAGREVS